LTAFPSQYPLELKCHISAWVRSCVIYLQTEQWAEAQIRYKGTYQKYETLN